MFRAGCSKSLAAFKSILALSIHRTVGPGRPVAISSQLQKKTTCVRCQAAQDETSSFSPCFGQPVDIAEQKGFQLLDLKLPLPQIGPYHVLYKDVWSVSIFIWVQMTAAKLPETRKQRHLTSPGALPRACPPGLRFQISPFLEPWELQPSFREHRDGIVSGPAGAAGWQFHKITGLCHLASAGAVGGGWRPCAIAALQVRPPSSPTSQDQHQSSRAW